MKQDNRKQNIKRERILMITSSAFVMAALTMTGVYMKETREQDGYNMDFSGMENNVKDKYGEIAQFMGKGLEGAEKDPLPQNEIDPLMENDLDYFPAEDPSEAAGSNRIEIPGVTDKKSTKSATVTNDRELARVEEARVLQEATESSELLMPEETMGQQVSFTPDQGLLRPVSGAVLIPYSVDSTVYFKTLDQYKYSRATVYEAVVGTEVVACSEGFVSEIFSNEEIGQAVTLDLGNGYRATYGQLQDIKVVPGEYVEAGRVLGSVGEPTKYYCVEGSNLYFALTLDGTSMDPENLFH